MESLPAEEDPWSPHFHRLVVKAMLKATLRNSNIRLKDVSKTDVNVVTISNEVDAVIVTGESWHCICTFVNRALLSVFFYFIPAEKELQGERHDG